jgi:diaminopimelate decarboxylase
MPANADTAPAADILGLFPPGSKVDPDGELVVGGCRLADLAATWDTPLFILDEEGVRSQVRLFRRALAARWGNARMVFASKAFPCTAMYRLIASEGIGADVAGAGELAMALAGGVDPAAHRAARQRQDPRRTADGGRRRGRPDRHRQHR